MYNNEKIIYINDDLTCIGADRVQLDLCSNYE